MKQLHLKQNTPEWEQFRRTHLGASDAPTICGVNPFCTPYKLWKQKALGEKQAVTDAMAKGHRLESFARGLAEFKFATYLQDICVGHDSIPYLFASLDGYCEKKNILVEVKCPGVNTFEKVKADGPPLSWIYQVNQQLEVANLDKGHIFVYNEELHSFHVHEVTRDAAIVEEIKEKSAEFYRMLINFEAPPDTHEHREDEEWKFLSSRFLHLKAKYEEIEEELKQARQALIEATNDTSCKGSGVIATKIVKRGSIDYAKIPELKKYKPSDFDHYRKVSREEWRVDKIKTDKIQEAC